jgi:nitric oxide reductase NorQ protein
LVKVSCHEDLSADDLLGRYLLDGTYVDGAGLSAFRNGSILYLEEFVESRKDVQVMVHPLADKPRILTVEKLGRIFEAHPEFMLVLSYNPGYQTIGKEPKPSTRQRFITLDFDYAKPEDEARIIRQESGLDLETSMHLVQAAEKIRNLKGKDQGLDEGASTRLLINAGHLIKEGIPAKDAVQVAVINSLTYNPDTKRGIEEIINSVFP